MKEYSSQERLFFWFLAVISFFTLNLVFIYVLLWQPHILIEALKNPVAVVFIVESFILMGVLSYLLTKWKVTRLHWSCFVLLSLIGSMVFALPAVLLWPRRSKQ